jgi:hypothetical protein
MPGVSMQSTQPKQGECRTSGTGVGTSGWPRRGIRALVCLAALAALAPVASRGQQSTQQATPSTPPRPHSILLPEANRLPDANDQMEMREQKEKQDQDDKGKANSAANVERKKQIADDSAMLLKLATALKAEVDKTNKDTLSLDVIRKADEIERLAHSVKEKMKLSAGAT